MYDRARLSPLAVIGAVAGQVWPLLCFVSALLAASILWYLPSGDGVLVAMTWWYFKVVALGLVGSFALHELAHVMVLKRIATVSRIAIQRSAWRISIVPLGELTPRQTAGVAIAGPGSCMVAGSALWILDVGASLPWWYLAHGLFVLPMFGDGRSLLGALRELRAAG